MRGHLTLVLALGHILRESWPTRYRLETSLYLITYIVYLYTVTGLRAQYDM